MGERTELGIHAVAINYLVGNALLLHQGEGVDDGEKLADVVGAALISRFAWILLVFGGFLVYSGAKMAVKNGYMFGCYGDSLLMLPD